VVGPVALSSTIAAGGTVGSIGGQMIFNQENALGSTIATRSATGTLGGIWEYDAYGNEKSQSVTLQTDLRFAGKHGYISDPDTGFDLLGARYYIPRLGRFLTQDPIGHSGGLNLYAYCENNPLTMIDPDGRQGEKAPGLDSVTTNPGLARWALPSGRAAKALSKGQLPHYLGNLGAQQLIRQLVKDGIKDYAQEVVIEFVFQGASVIFRADVAWQDPKTGKLLFSESKVNGSRFTKNQEQILRSLMMSKNELPVILRSRKRFGSFKYGSRTTASLYSIFRTMIK
jgi:RHS repeat-associated protein